MSNNPDAAMRDGLAAVFTSLTEANHLQERARKQLSEIAPLIIGKHVKYGGHIHQIVRVYIGMGNHVTLTGVRYRNGVAGRREFYSGLLKRAEFVDV